MQRVYEWTCLGCLVPSSLDSFPLTTGGFQWLQFTVEVFNESKASGEKDASRQNECWEGRGIESLGPKAKQRRLSMGKPRQWEETLQMVLASCRLLVVICNWMVFAILYYWSSQLIFLGNTHLKLGSFGVKVTKGGSFAYRELKSFPLLFLGIEPRASHMLAR